jgi:hypothetical protein
MVISFYIIVVHVARGPMWKKTLEAVMNFKLRHDLISKRRARHKQIYVTVNDSDQERKQRITSNQKQRENRTSENQEQRRQKEKQKKHANLIHAPLHHPNSLTSKTYHCFRSPVVDQDRDSKGSPRPRPHTVCLTSCPRCFCRWR